jgi:hypothetical protein
MKKRVIAVSCAVVVGLLHTSIARAGTPTEVAADAVLVRPVCFAAMLAGSVAYIVTLPFTAPCGGAHKAANALVVVPAKMTFVRKMGDLDSLEESDE